MSPQLAAFILARPFGFVTAACVRELTAIEPALPAGSAVRLQDKHKAEAKAAAEYLERDYAATC